MDFLIQGGKMELIMKYTFIESIKGCYYCVSWYKILYNYIPSERRKEGIKTINSNCIVWNFQDILFFLAHKLGQSNPNFSSATIELCPSPVHSHGISLATLHQSKSTPSLKEPEPSLPFVGICLIHPIIFQVIQISKGVIWWQVCHFLPYLFIEHQLDTTQKPWLRRDHQRIPRSTFRQTGPNTPHQF